MHRLMIVMLVCGLGLSACDPSNSAESKPVAMPSSAEPASSSKPMPSSVATRPPKPTPPKALPVPAELSLSEKGREALQTLGNAPAYGGSAVGAAGSPVPAVRALRVLLAEKQAVAALEVVIEHGSLAGQLLAVSGIYFADHARFEALLAPYRTMSDTVLFRETGCRSGPTPVEVRTLVKKRGAVSYLGPDDTLGAWGKRNPGADIHFDIAGGGYPRLLRGWQKPAQKPAEKPEP